jgi:fibro-slime domain-containing protein
MQAHEHFWQRYRVEIGVFFFLFLTYAYFYQCGQHNEAARFDLVRAIVERGQVNIDAYCYNSADIIRYGTHMYSNKAPGTSLLGVVPFFFLWHFFRAFFNLPVWVFEHILTYVTTVVTVSLFSALAGALLFHLLVRLSRNVLFSFFVMLAYSLGTIVFPFSTMFFSHQLAGAFLFFCFYLLHTTRQRLESGSKASPIALIAAGFCAGFAVSIEYPTFLLSCLLGLYALWVLRKRFWIVGYFVLGAIGGGATLLAYDWFAFKRLIYIPYEAYTHTAQSSYPGHRKGFMGVTFLPSLSILWKTTFHPQRGLFYCNPVLILAIPGLFLLFTKKRLRAEALLFLLMAIFFIVFFNGSFSDSIVYWGGAYSTGPRHIIPVLPFLIIPLYVFADRVRLLFYPLLLVSIFFMLTATAVEPRLPYEYNNPLKQLLIPKFLESKLALNTLRIFDPHFTTEDSTAFNIGKLVRLKPAFELLPLYIFWLGGLCVLLMWMRRRVVGIAQELGAESRGLAEGKYLPTPRAAELIGVPAPPQRAWDFAPLARVFKPACTSRPRFSLVPVLLVTLAYLAGLFVAPIIHQHRVRTGLRTGSGLIGKYYRGKTWQGTPEFIRKDRILHFPWDVDGTPIPGAFSVEWNGSLAIDKPGIYRFTLESDDGSWLYLDNRLVVDNGGEHAAIQKSGLVNLTQGKHTIRVRYFNSQFSGVLKLFWTPPGGHLQIVPSEVLHSEPPGDQASRQRSF